MEDVWEPGAGVEESSGVMGCGTVRRLSWELERPSSARACGAWSEAVYNRAREVAVSREGVGGGRSSGDGRDNTTRLERRAPASSMHREQ